MLRQKEGNYDQEKDSPLVGGYGSRKNINFATEPEVGWGPYVRTSNVIDLLEQAAEEFPKSKTAIDASEFTYQYYEGKEVDAWKKKWLTVPPV